MPSNEANYVHVNAGNRLKTIIVHFVMTIIQKTRLDYHFWRYATKFTLLLYLFICVYCSCIFIVQELCDSRGGRPGLPVLTSLLVSVDVKIY